MEGQEVSAIYGDGHASPHTLTQILHTAAHRSVGACSATTLSPFPRFPTHFIPTHSLLPLDQVLHTIAHECGKVLHHHPILLPSLSFTLFHTYTHVHWS